MNHSETSARSNSQVPDALHNYDIHEEIGRGATSVVYRATCKRGRLRNRTVALKKILRCSGSTQIAHITSSTALHQALYHPSVVSILSQFSTPSAHYQVLEFCSNGSLSNFLHSRVDFTLSESELRGIAKTMVEALIYLKKERIIHRDIKPSNILLTDDFRIKLADFGLAVRLPSDNATTSTFCGSPNYVAPEVVSRIPYTFTADIWSLGCLLASCLTGAPIFEHPSVSEILANVRSGSYTLPSTISYEVRDLISGLLQLDTTHRIPLHRILSHPFFNPSLPIQLLSLRRHKSAILPQPIHSKLPENEIIPPLPNGVRRPRYPPSLSKVPSALQPVPTIPAINKRKPLSEIINTESDVRSVLSDELQRPLSTRRISSAPHASTPNLAPKRPLRATSWMTAKVGFGTTAAPETPALTPDGSTSFSRSSISASSGPLASSPPSHTRAPHSPPLSAVLISTRSPVKANAPLSPVSGSRRTFTTAYLKPHTYKLTHGQIVVLPSLSLLVDFREQQRRRGGKGDEVVVIEPGGTWLEVYSAPHLSTPCCLKEPKMRWGVNDAPEDLWEVYEEAGKVVDKIRRGVSKMVLNEPTVKCTLMANEAPGDIELIFHSPILPSLHFPRPTKKSETASSTTPAMRIRFSRHRRSLELARATGPLAGQWVKKVFVTSLVPSNPDGRLGEERRLPVSDDEWNSLEGSERDGLGELMKFVRVCEALEISDRGAEGSGGIRVTSGERPLHLGRNETRGSEETDGRQRLQDVLFNMEKHPARGEQTKPPDSGHQDKFQDVLGRRRDEEMTTVNAERQFSKETRTTNTLVAPYQHQDEDQGLISSLGSVRSRPSKFSQMQARGRQASKPRAEYLSKMTHANKPPSKMKHIPHVGWCVRSQEHLSGSGTESYTVMYEDGVSMIVNVAEDRVEITDLAGGTFQSSMSECTLDDNFGDRFKCFKGFLHLFSQDT